MTTQNPGFEKNPAYERWRLQIFGITWLAYAAFYFTRQAFSAAKVGILDDPAVNDVLTRQMLGNLDAVYLGAYALGQFTWGALADRFGPRVVVLGGLAMSIVAAVVMGSAAPLPIFATMMLVQGLAQSTGWSSLCKNMGSFFSTRERGRVLGLWSTNYGFGGLVAAPFVGWFAYSVFSDWHASFFSGAAIVAVVFVLFLLFQRDRPQEVGLPTVERYHGESEPVIDEHDRPQDEPEGAWKTIGEVLRNKMVLTLGAAYFLLKPTRYMLLLWGPVIVSERLPQVSNFEAVLIPIAFGVTGLSAPIIIGYVSDNLFGSRRVPATVLSLLALMVAMALFIPLTAAGSVWVMVVMLGLIGLFAFGPDSMISGSAAVDFGTRKGAGTATGFTNGCGSIGAVLGGLLPGYVGTGTLFYGFAGATLLSALVLLPHWNRMPATAEEPVPEPVAGAVT